jgi:hypothetical protein
MFLPSSPSLGWLFVGGLVATLFDGIVVGLLIAAIHSVGRAEDKRAAGM